jgi:SagB-type dehydrogenase family enzyme
VRDSNTTSRRTRRAGATPLWARINGHVRLEAHPDGRIFACFDQHLVDLGPFGANAAHLARELSADLPLKSIVTGEGTGDQEIQSLVGRLARHGLLEYYLGGQTGDDVVVEPQVADYQPRMPPLHDADFLVLSRFAYLRRRADQLLLESPLAGAVFGIRNPKIAALLALLSTPKQLKGLRRQDGFPGVELLALLLDSRILFKIAAGCEGDLRRAEGDDGLVLWDFHDLLFHTRSTEGRHANVQGGLYPYVGIIAPLAPVRPRWPGKKVDLTKYRSADSQEGAHAAELLRARHSSRNFDDRRPITLLELARFLDGAARVHSKWTGQLELGDRTAKLEYAARPYPSGGASYELELYLAVDKCEGLARGFYHYDAGAHALVPIVVEPNELDAMLASASFAMDTAATAQVLITIAGRFGRVSWKYSSLAYSLVLKNVGALTQTLYLMATDLGLGGCAIGSVDIELFAKMTGLEFHTEGAVGQFAMGRAAKQSSVQR